MPNFKVFQDVPSQLLAQISQPTAASLLVQPQNLTAASLLVQPQNLTAASLLVQPQNLTAASLVVQAANLTAASLIVQLGERTTAESIVSVTNTGDSVFKDGLVEGDLLRFDKATFTVRNAGSANSAKARLLLSADSILFTLDGAESAIAPTDQFFFVPSKFTKYGKVQYASVTDGLTTSLSIIFQAQV